MKSTTLTIALLAALSAPAAADTLVQPGGKPGVATSWKASGDKVVLEIKEGFAAAEVAEAIKKAVPGAKAEAKGQTVSVAGVPQDKLITALERIEVSPAADDIDAMFASIQNPGSEDEGSGSSIRATQNTEIPEPGEGAKVMATVVGVRHNRFPLVAVTVRVDQVDGTQTGVAKGGQIVVVPLVQTKDGIIQSGDARSQKNVSAWYARAGDKVSLQLGQPEGKKFWVALAFERLR